MISLPVEEVPDIALRRSTGSDDHNDDVGSGDRMAGFYYLKK